MTIVAAVKSLYHNTFNPKFAAVSALANGTIAAQVNSGHGGLEMLAAAGTQAVSSFLSTGFTARVVQHFSPVQNKVVSYALGSLVPAGLTLAMSYIGHSINQTPETANSCIAPTAISFTTSFVTNYITRKGYMRPANYPAQ